MKAFVTQQSQEVEQAIISGGKYELNEQHKSLDASKQWWTMTEEQRKLLLKTFHSSGTRAGKGKERCLGSMSTGKLESWLFR